MKNVNFETIWDNIMLAVVVSSFICISVWGVYMLTKPFVCNICAVAAGV